jgi:ketosteroid isomerase-like protein
MSQENVQMVREALDAYNRGDKDGWTKFMDPELETISRRGVPRTRPNYWPGRGLGFLPAVRGNDGWNRAVRNR